MTTWPNSMPLHCGRKLECPKETHAGTRRTCKLHTEKAQSVCMSCEEGVLTTTPTCFILTKITNELFLPSLHTRQKPIVRPQFYIHVKLTRNRTGTSLKLWTNLALYIWFLVCQCDSDPVCFLKHTAAHTSSSALLLLWVLATSDNREVTLDEFLSRL